MVSLNTMLEYNELIKANKEYRQKHSRYEKPYRQARKIDWNVIYQFTNSEIRNKVLYYLNKFGCRININLDVVDGIRNAHKKSIPFIDALRNQTLLDINFNKVILIYCTKFKFSEIIATVFHNFSSIGHRFSHVASSKLLHQINPNLFMMWDNAIISTLNLGKKPNDYAEEYLPRMKNLLNQMIQRQMDSQQITRQEAINQLDNIQQNKTPPKLLDEYLWIKTRKR